MNTINKKQLKIEELSLTEFNEITQIHIQASNPTNLILKKVETSNLRYYYMSFVREDFLEKISNLNPGYNINMMKLYYIPIQNIKMYIATY